ncbi:hypothetical protein SNEBB_005523 [Seison nebaliae]|nr:hypothetical protein SNEBB_005523 [Seison nebaliae]
MYTYTICLTLLMFLQSFETYPSNNRMMMINSLPNAPYRYAWNSMNYQPDIRGSRCAPVSCYHDPCSEAVCPIPEATCRVNYCGACSPEWYIGDHRILCGF